MRELEPRKKTTLEIVLYWLLPALAVCLIVGGWIWFSAKNPRLMPNPIQVYERFIRTFTRPVARVNLLGHAWASLKRVLTALVFAWVIGITLGILIGWNRAFKSVIGTLFEIIRPIPPIAWIPIVIMWFGIEEFPRILIVFIGTFVPSVINTAAGIALVDKINMDVGRIFGGNKYQILGEILIPTALPSIFAGMRTSVSSGWTTVLAAEMIAAQYGLGAVVVRGWQGDDMALVMVAVISIAVIGALLAFSLDRLEKLVTPWTK